MTETIRFFDRDSKMTEFTGTVIACEPDGELYKVILDQTAFFPEEGGQTCDRGTIDGIEVVKVHEKERIVYHWLKKPLSVGSIVNGKIDWEKRFSDMQQHSGEHIVSGLVHAKYGYDNVGFHLGSEFVTMDFNGVLSQDELKEIEILANRAITENISIRVTWPSKEELDALPYRSKKELEGPIRIVEVPGYDICACCAPHVHTTGEIGMIKFVNMEKYKGGMRVYMLCGFRALADYQEKIDTIKQVSVLLSAKNELIPEYVKKQKDDIAELKQLAGELKMQLIEAQIAGLTSANGHACLISEHIDKSNIRRAHALLSKKFPGLCACFGGNDVSGYQFVAGGQGIDAKAEGQKMIASLGGRGGGNKDMFQGSIQADRMHIESYFVEL